ncbi:MAG: branched-chain amino acid ABC transporter substrate-binding protein [Actinomycetota bacterium]|nr:branched-chain amino acid ABC transporter substrate-binding protein [Actinomycetota bacterium]
MIRGTLAGALIAALALAGCGGGGGASTTRSLDRTIDVYSSLPLQGPSSSQGDAILNGIKLALSQADGRAGRWTVDYRSLDDSSAASGIWDPGQTEANAQKAASDPKTVLYLGELDSDASALSIPILNQAGIAQISPASTYAGLTTQLAGDATGEPMNYNPTGTRTFLRLVPIDSIQAAADLIAMKQVGCQKVAVADDGGLYGTGLAKMLELEQRLYGVSIASTTVIDPRAASFDSYAAAIAAIGADCFFFAGRVSSGAVAFTEALHTALPAAKIFGGDGVCTAGFMNPKLGGVPRAMDRLIECTAPAGGTLRAAAYSAFLKAYKARYGDHHPDPYAVYGYEAMKLGLQTIARLGHRGADRSAVRAALFSTQGRQSAIGTYGFQVNGETTLAAYGLYRAGPGGYPVLLRTIAPGST